MHRLGLLPILALFLLANLNVSLMTSSLIGTIQFFTCTQRISYSSIFRIIQASYSLNRASLRAQLIKNPPARQETPVPFLGEEDPLEKDKLPTPIFQAFLQVSAGKEFTCSVGGLGSIPGLGMFVKFDSHIFSINSTKENLGKI